MAAPRTFLASETTQSQSLVVPHHNTLPCVVLECARVGAMARQPAVAWSACSDQMVGVCSRAYEEAGMCGAGGCAPGRDARTSTDFCLATSTVNPDREPEPGAAHTYIHKYMCRCIQRCIYMFVYILMYALADLCSYGLPMSTFIHLYIDVRLYGLVS